MAQTNKMIGCYDVESWKEQFDKYKSTPQLVVVSFISPTSGQWYDIAPDVSTLPRKFSEVIFLRVDVNELKSVAKEYGVTTLPTFVFLKSGVEVKKIVAPEFEELKMEIGKNRRCRLRRMKLKIFS